MLITPPHVKILAMVAKLNALYAIPLTPRNVVAVCAQRASAESELFGFIRKQQLCN